jgi:hypothetical protein
VKVGIETDRGPWVAALAFSAALRPMSEHPFRSRPHRHGPTERYRPNSRVSGLERAAQPGYRSAAWSLSASWTVSSAAGSASKRSSGMGAPVRIDRP